MKLLGRLNPQGRAPFEMITSKGATGTYTKRSARSKAFEEFKSNNPFASQQFIAALEPVTSQPKIKDIRGGGRKTKGRLIYKVWARDSAKIYEAILKAIDKSTTEFNRITEIKKAA
jgi:DNA-directed RNA polymerase alpha subunit